MNSLIYFNNCASTQDELIDFLNQHYLSEDFLAIHTFNQTKGRGQYGNSWKNLPEENLAYSFALKTKNINISDTCFNFYTAILVRDFIANLTKTEVKIKWPNDLILKNKKICGMLFEKDKNYFVVGIGINIPKGAQIIDAKGLKQISDSGALEAIIDQVLAANQKSVEEFRSGKEKAFNALVGQIMKASQGKANPGQVNELLRKKLS